MSAPIPAGTAVLVNLVRIGYGEPARSFALTPAGSTTIDQVAAEAGMRAASTVDRGVVPGISTVITVNLLGAVQGRGGCSWQCLTVSRPIERAEFAAIVGGIVSGMVAHAAAAFIAEGDAPLPGTPVANAPSTDRRQ